LPEWLRSLFTEAVRFAKGTTVTTALIQPGMERG
jgi:hypothetical protein